MPDLLAEPAFATPIRAIAAGYDRHYSPEPDATNPLVVAPRSVEELRERATVVHTMDLALAVTYGSLMTLLTAAPRMSGVDPVYKERLEAYVEDATRRDIRIAECITDAKGNRTLPPSQQDDPDVYVRVVDRRPDGVVIRGRQAAHQRGVARPRSDGHADQGDEAGGGGLLDRLRRPRQLARRAHHQHDVPSPRRATSGTSRSAACTACRTASSCSTTSSCRDERVFLDGETSNATVFAHALGLWERLGGVTAMVTQADQLVGLAQLIAEANGLARVPHIRDKIDEMLIHATLLRAGLEAALSTPTPRRRATTTPTSCSPTPPSTRVRRSST